MCEEHFDESIRSNKMLAASLTTTDKGRAIEGIDIAIISVVMAAFLWLIFVLTTVFLKW
jgi:hypothetical protein